MRLPYFLRSSSTLPKTTTTACICLPNATCNQVGNAHMKTAANCWSGNPYQFACFEAWNSCFQSICRGSPSGLVTIAADRPHNADRPEPVYSCILLFQVGQIRGSKGVFAPPAGGSELSCKSSWHIFAFRFDQMNCVQ